MKPVLSVGTHTLFQVRGQLPYAWFADGGTNYKADFRNDSLIYVSGFRTREEAEQWARREDIMP